MKRTYRSRNLALALAGLTGAFCASAALAQAPNPVYNKENNRLVTNPSVGVDGFTIGTGDTQEKDFAWGDLNNNGWVDLVNVRKQPFTSVGKRQNQLYMNENGILVDRTAQYASAADQSQIVTSPGWTAWNGVGNGNVNYGTNPLYNPDQGFLSPTNDRMAALADFRDVGWLDIVTAPTLSDGDPKHIGHPRYYRNLANDGSGQWQGFIFENSRIPAMNSKTGASGHNPRFCSIDAGDVTGNGWIDLYFGDYDSAPGAPPVPSGGDFDDKLLINQGEVGNPGYFVDETNSRFSGNVPGFGQNFRVSAFGAAVVIADINANGHNDIVKQTALQNPQYVGVAYNLDGDGVFKASSYYQVVAGTATLPYFVAAGDLNNNGRLDLVVSSDAQDRYWVNLSTNPDGTVNWSGGANNNGIILPGSPSNFSGDILIGPLRYHESDPNAFNDIIVTDVDVDISGCSRVTDFFKNNENGLNVTFTNISSAVMPQIERTGVHDVAVMDITGNGWLDLVVARCNNINVWINDPPVVLPDLVITYPNGLPDLLVAEEPTDIVAHLTPVNGSLDAGSVTLHVSVNGGSFAPQAMANSGGGNFTGTIPPVDCDDVVDFYVSADVENETFTDPSDAPTTVHSAIAVEDVVTVVSEIFDSGSAGWDVQGNPTLGEWVVAEPTGALLGSQVAAPFDASVGANAFVTCPGCNGGSCTSTCQVNDGPTHLLSPTLDLDGELAIITYDRWMYSRTGNDFLRTYVSNDNGATWQFVHETNDTSPDWETVSFYVDDYVTPTSQVRVRFAIDDFSASSVTNAGIDNFNVEVLDCGDDDPPPPTCPADLTGDNVVNVFDLLDLLAAWGPCADPNDCPADLNGDFVVNVFDLLDLLAAWGPCSP